MTNNDFKTKAPWAIDPEEAQGRYRGVLPQKEIEESRKFLKENGLLKRGNVAVAEPNSTPDGEYIVLSIGGLPCIPKVSNIKVLLPKEVSWTEVLANRGVDVAGTAKISNGLVSYSPRNSKDKEINFSKLPIIRDAATLERIVDYATA